MWQNIKNFLHSPKSIILYLPFFLLLSLYLTPGNKIKAVEEVDLNVIGIPTTESYPYYLIHTKTDKVLYAYITNNSKDVRLSGLPNSLTSSGSYKYYKYVNNNWELITTGSSGMTLAEVINGIKYHNIIIYKDSSFTTIAFTQAPVPEVAPLKLAVEQGLKQTQNKLKTTFGKMLPGGLLVLSMLLVTQLVRRVRLWLAR